MVEIDIRNARLVVTVKGIHKLFAFRHRLAFPIEAVEAAAADRPLPSIGRMGLRAPGTHVPGLITAGTFYRDGRRTFWNVRNRDRAIVIDLSAEDYDRLIVEVEDPPEAVRRIRRAKQSAGGKRE